MIKTYITDHTVIKVALLVLLLAGPVHANVTGSLDKDAGWYPAGTNITVTADPGLYSRLDRWEGDTATAVIADDVISLTADGSKTITAVFAPEVTDAGAVPHYWLADVNPDWTNDFESAATNDWDGDGFTTEQEYWSGTNPTNRESYLAISGVTPIENGLQLVWAHDRVDSRIPSLHIEGRASMSAGSWEYVDENQPADGMVVWDTPAAAADYRFFRLRANQTP